MSLVYGSYPNMFLLIFSLILSLIPVLKPSFLIHVLILFCFSPESTGILSPCLLIFNSQWNECCSFQTKGTWLFELANSYKLLCLYLWYCFLFISFYCFYPWLYTLNVSSLTSNLLNIFNIAVHVFGNIFWKICPLFGQILIRCLECFRASFSLSSYSEKMCWGRGCLFSGNTRFEICPFALRPTTNADLKIYRYLCLHIK